MIGNCSPSRLLRIPGRILKAAQPPPILRHRTQILQSLVDRSALVRRPLAALELDEEHVVPAPFTTGPRVDTRQRDRVLLEHG